MKKRLVILILLFLFVAIFISGCAEKTDADAYKLEIKNAQYENGNLLLTLYTNSSVSNVSIDIIGDQGMLCSKQRDLDAGTNHLEFSDCKILEDKIVVSVKPPIEIGEPSVREFSLGLPLFKFQKGFRYDYSVITCASCYPYEISLYVTKETRDRWEGIAGMKKTDLRAYLLRYRIDKNDLSLLATDILNESQINQENMEYKNPDDLGGDASNILHPFLLIAFKQKGLNLNELIQNRVAVFSQLSQDWKIESTEIKDNFFVYKIVTSQTGSGPNLGTIYVATTKPYLLLTLESNEGGGISFIGSERNGFSLDDYAGYTIEGSYGIAQEQVPILKQPE